MKQSNIGVAVVGAGRIGTLRARLAAKHPAVGFLAISDKDPACARALAEQAGAQFHSGSNDEVISHPYVSAVFVSTPEQEHTKPILRALRIAVRDREEPHRRVLGGEPRAQRADAAGADDSDPDVGLFQHPRH